MKPTLQGRDERLRAQCGLDPESRPRGILPAALAFLLARAAWVLTAMMLLTTCAAYLGSKLPLVTDFAALLPQDARSLQEERAAAPYLGNPSVLVIVIEEEPDPRSTAPVGQRAQEAADVLAARLETDPEFPRVRHRFDRAFFENNALLYLPVDELQDLRERLERRIEAEILRANPFFVDLMDEEDELERLDLEAILAQDADPRAVEMQERLTDETGTTHILLVQPSEPATDVTYNRHVLERVEQHLSELALRERLGVAVFLSGNYPTAVDEHDAVRRDLGRAGLISAALLLTFIAIYFRRVRATWIVFVPLLSGVIMMMGYVALVVGRLNTITGFSFALFMGLSVDLAVHLLARYDEERARGHSVFDALLTTYRQTGRAAAIAGVTSSAAFLALSVARFEGIREFGLIAGGGILICLAVIAIELPVIIALSLRLAGETRIVPLRIGRVLRRRVLGSRRRHRVVTVIALLAVALLAERARHLTWEDSFRNLRGGPAEAIEVADRIQDILGRSAQPATRIAPTLAEAEALARACDEERARRGPATTVQMCLSLADFIPDDQPGKLAIIAELRELLSDDRLDALDDPDTRERLAALRASAPTEPITEADLPVAVRESYVSEAGDAYFMRAYPAVATWRVSNNVRFADELMAIDHVSDLDIGPIGTAMIMADLMRVIQRDSVVVTSVALGAVLVVLMLVFRSIPRALSCYLPLLAGLVCTAGLMVLLRMRLGFFNMIALPSLIGIGVDNNIHLVHRYHVEGRGSWHHVVDTTGSACIVAALTTMAGFAGLLAASHLGLRTIGELALLGIATCTLVSLTLLPAALSWLESALSGTGRGLVSGREYSGPAAAAQDAHAAAVEVPPAD